MTKVVAKRGESPDKLLARFKRAVNRDGTLKELKKRQHYEKPSEKRRRKEKERIKSMRRAARERANPSLKKDREQDNNRFRKGGN